MQSNTPLVPSQALPRSTIVRSRMFFALDSTFKNDKGDARIASNVLETPPESWEMITTYVRGYI